MNVIFNCLGFRIRMTTVLLVSDISGEDTVKNVFYVSSETYSALDGKTAKAIPVWLNGEMNTTADMPAWIKQSSKPGKFLAGNGFVRNAYGMAFGAKIAVKPMGSYETVPASKLVSAEVFRSGDKITIQGDTIIETCLKTFNHHFILPKTILHITIGDVVICIRILSIDGTYGRIDSTTQFKLTVASQSKDNLVMTRPTNTSMVFRSIATDFTNLAVGGMDSQLREIVERLLASRLLSPAIVTKMGLNHVRGVLFYGPPGCGKTLIARELAKVLKAHPPKIVNGPELLSKWVGGSEENVRNLFKEAEEEQRLLGEESQLHLIVLDEIDALCRRRGTSSDSTGVQDNIVNQLLSKIDGVEPLNNVIIIGMTNRRELLDEALMRPGRLELQIEIGLPDETGRLQILELHTRSLQKNGYLATDVVLPTIASLTKNYTGAELEGLVRTARSAAMSRCIDSRKLIMLEDKQLLITHADFMNAIKFTKPAFGTTDELEESEHGFVALSPEFSNIVKKLETIVQSPESNSTVIGIDGSRGCGATTVAKHLARKANLPYVRIITADKLLGMRESERVSHIMDVFNASMRSDGSVIIVDDMASCIEYIEDDEDTFTRMPPRYNSSIVHALNVMLARRTHGRLIVIVTHPVQRFIKKHIFTTCVELPEIDAENIRKIIPYSMPSNSMPVKRMFAVGDLAKTCGWTEAIAILN